MLVTAFGCIRGQRIDRNHVGAVLLGGVNEVPLMHVRRQQVGTPDENQLRVGEVLWIGPDGPVHRHAQGGVGSGITNCRVEPRGAEVLKEALPERPALDRSECAGVIERQNRLRTVAVDRRLEGCGGQADRLVPVDCLETPLALLTNASQRGCQSIRRVDGIEIAVDLAA